MIFEYILFIQNAAAAAATSTSTTTITFFISLFSTLTVRKHFIKFFSFFQCLSKLGFPIHCLFLELLLWHFPPELSFLGVSFTIEYLPFGEKTSLFLSNVHIKREKRESKIKFEIKAIQQGFSECQTYGSTRIPVYAYE
jgi:hypothetical protein